MAAIKLNSLRFENPKAPALVILHGLLGASRNWQTIGKALKDRFDVHILDLRNHGSSPHAETMRWSELNADLSAYLRVHDLKNVTLMGHSLGGKIAMRFACDHSAVVAKLIIVDIAAKKYPPYHDAEFRAMKRVPAGAIENRREAEELLKPLIPDWGTAAICDDEPGARGVRPKMAVQPRSAAFKFTGAASELAQRAR